jgi:hypothetical protein
VRACVLVCVCVCVCVSINHCLGLRIVEANNTVDLNSLQFMAPRQLAAKGNEQWMCYLTAMTTKYPQSEGASRVGYCKMYVDSHRWALGGWSESHMHMSCSGYCTKATPEGKKLTLPS